MKNALNLLLISCFLLSSPYSYGQSKHKRAAPKVSSEQGCDPNSPFLKNTKLICAGCASGELCIMAGYTESAASIKNKWVAMFRAQLSKKRSIKGEACGKVIESFSSVLADENFQQLQKYVNHPDRDKLKHKALLFPVTSASLYNHPDLEGVCGGNCDGAIKDARAQVVELMGTFPELSKKDVAYNVKAFREQFNVAPGCADDFNKIITNEFMARMKKQAADKNLVESLNSINSDVKKVGKNEGNCPTCKDSTDDSAGGNGLKHASGDAIFGDPLADKNSNGRAFCMNMEDNGRPVPMSFEAEKNPAKTSIPQCFVTAKQMYDQWSGQMAARAGTSLNKFDPWNQVGKDNKYGPATSNYHMEKGLKYWNECAKDNLTFDLNPSVDALLNYIKKQDPKNLIKRSDLIGDDFPDGDELAKLADANDPKKFSIACDLLEGKACLNARPKLRAEAKRFEGETDANAMARIMNNATGVLGGGKVFISDNATRDNLGSAYVDGITFGFTETGKQVYVQREDYLKACNHNDPNVFENTVKENQEWQQHRATEVGIVWTIFLSAITGGLAAEVALGGKVAMTGVQAAKYAQTAKRITLASELLWFGGVDGGVRTYNNTGSMMAAAQSMVLNMALIGTFRVVSNVGGKYISKAAQSELAQTTMTKLGRFIPSAEGKGLIPLTVNGLSKVLTSLAPHVPAATLVFVTSCALDKKCDWTTVVKALGITASGVISAKIAKGIAPLDALKFKPDGRTIAEPTVKDYEALGIKQSDLDGKTTQEAMELIRKAYKHQLITSKDIHPDKLGLNATDDAIAASTEKLNQLLVAKAKIANKYKDSSVTEVAVTEDGQTAVKNDSSVIITEAPTSTPQSAGSKTSKPVVGDEIAISPKPQSKETAPTDADGDLMLQIRAVQRDNELLVISRDNSGKVGSINYKHNNDLIEANNMRISKLTQQQISKLQRDKEILVTSRDALGNSDGKKYMHYNELIQAQRREISRLTQQLKQADNEIAAKALADKMYILQNQKLAWKEELSLNGYSMAAQRRAELLRSIRANNKEIDKIAKQLNQADDVVDDMIIKSKEEGTDGTDLVISLKSKQNEPLSKHLNSDPANREAFVQLVKGDTALQKVVKNYLAKADPTRRTLFNKIITKIAGIKTEPARTETVKKAKEVLNDKACQ